MVLEATLICLDNSEYMRNGDYTPSRLEAQNDAVALICGAKTQSNAENTVGVMTCGSKRPEVLVTLTHDLGKILTSVHGIRIDGTLHFSDSLQIAQLALKHRQNKNQRQRIIAFVGSPLEEDEKELVKLAKKMKKNNVAVDIINFGEETENTEKLEAFVAAVNSGDNSHLLTVPPGPHILSDIIVTSPILNEDGAPAGVPGVPGGGGFEFGVDPSIDPELALALRISMEEERERQARLAAEEEKKNAPASSSATNPSTETKSESTADVTMTDANQPVPEDIDIDDEEAMLAQAIAMSMGDVQMADETNNEENELQRALALSDQFGGDTGISDVLQDAELMGNILGSLPGVDPNDPRIRSVLEGLSGENKEKKESEEEKKESEEKKP